MLSRPTLATLLLALPLTIAQEGQGSAPGANGEQDGPKGPDNLPTAGDKPGDESQPNWPQWVTNDYPCVIECCQGFNGAEVSRDPNPDLEGTTRQCVLDKCNKDSVAENLYQMTYIVQTFYQTGSIYECEGKPCTPAGENPDTTASSGQAESHSANPAVSIAPISNGASDAGGSTVVETATASDGTVSESTSVVAEGSSSENGAGRSGWSFGLALAAVGVAAGNLV